jgi:hypothetical protein
VSRAPTSLDIAAWGRTTEITLEWESGEGDARLAGWLGADGVRAIETNADTIWSEDPGLDMPFDLYWEARSLSHAYVVGYTDGYAWDLDGCESIRDLSPEGWDEATINAMGPTWCREAWGVSSDDDWGQACDDYNRGAYAGAMAAVAGDLTD